MARGRNNKASATAPSSSPSQSSVVEQLSMLRSFVGASTTFSETDLSNCLRQSGYVVEVAAERLMTGQYQQAKRLKTNTMEATTPLQSQSIASVPAAKSVKHATSASTTRQNTNTKKPTPNNARRPPAPVVTPKTPKRILLSNKKNDDSSSFESSWLLCHRWVSDGVCTQRNGSLDYLETLQVETTDAGMLRFRGSNIQGQFPKHLSHAMGPLLLLSKNSNNHNTLIRLEAHALMEERLLPIGAQVAFSLSVWLPDPAAFFQLFQEDLQQTTKATTKLSFFGKATSNSKTQPKRNLVCDAAFGLLQWAQQGEPHVDLFGVHSGTEREEDSEPEQEQLLLEEEDDMVEHDDETVPEWARLETTTQSSCHQEMDAPDDFKVQLRPYQRQALWWMTQREAHTQLEESTQQQLQLLKELASSDVTVTTQPAHRSNNSIHCDCGPVTVDVDTTATAAPAVVDNGTIPNLNHPLWERRYLASHDRTEAMSFYVQPLFGMAMASPPPPPQPCRGGLLADSMGLGKTVMLLALIQHTKGAGNTTLIVTPLSLLAQWEDEITSKTNLSHRVHYGDNKSKTTHVDFEAVDVVLTTYGSLQGELQSHVRRQTQQKGEANIIIPPPLAGLLAYSWNRVILDEAHCIKNAATVASRACCLLRAERRWCVSGTIIQNSLEDAYALLKFLRHEPWYERSFWKAAITKQTDRTVALDRVRRVLSPIMLRRTKESVDKDGKPILILPPIDSKTIMVEFAPAERQFYDALHRKSLNLFEGFIQAGTASKSWLAIFSLLHRLRQTCDHVALTVKAHLDQDEWNSNIAAAQTSENNSSRKQPKGRVPSEQGGGIDQKFLNDLMGKFRSMQSTSKKKDQTDAPYATKIANMLNDAVRAKSSLLEEECSICLDPINIHDSVVTPCFHIFCKDCLVNVLRERPSGTQNNNESKSNNNISPVLRCPNGPCPVCTEEIDSSKILRISESDGRIQTSSLLSSLKSSECVAMKEEDGAARHALETAVLGSSSSKLTAILQELDNVWKEDPGSKVLVFSQFLGFLDLMEQSLKSNKIPFSRLDGKLSLKERMAVLQEFGTEKAPRVNNSDSESSNRVGSVLLISMKAGGVGLNLVAARTVFISDPWWNAAVEDQCVDRIHRIGQTADKVRVRKFYMSNSVEERIVELQKRKKNVAAEVLGDKGETGTEGSGARPSLDDFQILFRDARVE